MAETRPENICYEMKLSWVQAKRWRRLSGKANHIACWITSNPGRLLFGMSLVRKGSDINRVEAHTMISTKWLVFSGVILTISAIWGERLSYAGRWKTYPEKQFYAFIQRNDTLSLKNQEVDRPIFHSRRAGAVTWGRACLIAILTTCRPNLFRNYLVVFVVDVQLLLSIFRSSKSSSYQFLAVLPYELSLALFLIW